jgi:hypothetical protein
METSQIYKNVIIIPYRNRQPHLEYFLNNAWPHIEKNLENTKLAIIEQNGGKNFNRGKVLNVGYDLHKDAEYLYFNDVDTNPTEKTIINLYSKLPAVNEIISIYSAQCSFLGGTLKIRTSDFKEINGFPNDFWGWGIEDRALYNRSCYFNKVVQRNLFPETITQEDFTIFDDIKDKTYDPQYWLKDHFEYKCCLNESKEVQYKHLMRSGLNNLDYSVISRETLMPNVEKIKIDI